MRNPISSVNPGATFDCLFLAEKFSRDTGSFSPPEIHLFAYLSCLLSLYQGSTVADWGYSFVGTELGAPFSIDIDASVRTLEERGLLLRLDQRFELSDPARYLLQEFAELESNRSRSECLGAAWSSTAALSVGIVGGAIAEEPELRRARDVPATRQLLEDPALDELYEQFGTLKNVLRDRGMDLRVPAVVWLESLFRIRELSAE